jgi:hypothetical protein
MKVRVIKDNLGYRPQVLLNNTEVWQYVEEKGWFKKTYFLWIMFPEHGSVFSNHEAAVDCLSRYKAHLDIESTEPTVIYEAEW